MERSLADLHRGDLVIIRAQNPLRFNPVNDIAPADSRPPTDSVDRDVTSGASTTELTAAQSGSFRSRRDGREFSNRVRLNSGHTGSLEPIGPVGQSERTQREGCGLISEWGKSHY